MNILKKNTYKLTKAGLSMHKTFGKTSYIFHYGSVCYKWIYTKTVM